MRKLADNDVEKFKLAVKSDYFQVRGIVSWSYGVYISEVFFKKYMCLFSIH